MVKAKLALNLMHKRAERVKQKIVIPMLIHKGD